MTKSQTQLVVIMLIALVSLGGSYLLFYSASKGLSWGTTNHGEFVEPRISVRELGWQVQGKFAADVDGHWWLWVLAEDCGSACRQSVKDLRALHILLNKEAERVRRGFTGVDAVWQGLQADYPGLAQVQLSSSMPALRKGIYIADPLGNLVFYYPMDVNPKLIQQDLKKLLKVSQIG